MTILTEEGVRKIIRKKMINEIGFRNVSSDVGVVRYDECDLSKLNDLAKRDLVIKFAKHFLLNPQMKETTPEGDKFYTDRHFISFITGFKNLTVDEQNKYDRDVKRYLSENPEVIKKYVDLISYGITVAFGKLAPFYCDTITTFLVNSTFTDFKEEENEYIEVEKIKEKFIQVTEVAGRSFKTEMGIVRGVLQRKEECFIIYPQTSKLLYSAGDRVGATREFDDREKDTVENMITEDEMTPRDLYQKIEDNFNRSPITNVNKILKPIKSFMNNSEIQTVEHGDQIREALQEIADSALAEWRRDRFL